MFTLLTNQAELVKKSASMSDDQIVDLALAAISFYINSKGYGDMAECIAIYEGARPYVRCFESLASTHVLWSVDFAHYPNFKVQRDYTFGA